MNETLGNWNTANGTNRSSPHIFASDFVHFWFITYYVLVGCGGFVNLLVMYVMLRSHKIRTSISSFLIFHLSVTHVVFHMAVPLFRLNWSRNCKAFVLIELSCSAAIFGSLVAIAWDRHRETSCNRLKAWYCDVRRRTSSYSRVFGCTRLRLLRRLFTVLERNLEKYAGKRKTQLKSVGITLSVMLLQTGRHSCQKRCFLSWRLFSPSRICW